jgi:hypothetical protein
MPLVAGNLYYRIYLTGGRKSASGADGGPVQMVRMGEMPVGSGRPVFNK